MYLARATIDVADYSNIAQQQQQRLQLQQRLQWQRRQSQYKMSIAADLPDCQ